MSNSTWAQRLDLLNERIIYSQTAHHRTDWAPRLGPRYMVPWDGNELSGSRPGISAADLWELSNCLWDAGGEECGYQPLYTPCLVPDTGPQGDGFAPTDTAIAVRPVPTGETNADRMVRVTWKYLNCYGGVPRRDDVRFNLAVKETSIPPGGQAPAASEYPSIDEAKGKKISPIYGEISTSGSVMLIQNISYAGHVRWTEPTASTDLRDFEVNLPGTCDRRYLVRILPKRFCFDQSDVLYSSGDQKLYADVICH